MRKLFPMLLSASVLTGCVTAKYTVVAGEYGWDKPGKNGSEGSEYASQTMYKLNTKTGESWRMSFDKQKGYYWDPINHLNLNSQEN